MSCAKSVRRISPLCNTALLDERAKPLLSIDVVFAFKGLQGPPHRHTADVKVLPQLFFGGQFLVDLIFTLVDLLMHPVTDLFMAGTPNLNSIENRRR